MFSFRDRLLGGLLQQVGLERTGGATNYRGLLAKLPAGQIILEQAYTGVENLINRVKDYVGVKIISPCFVDSQVRECLFESGMVTVSSFVGFASRNALRTIGHRYGQMDENFG